MAGLNPPSFVYAEDWIRASSRRRWSGNRYYLLTGLDAQGTNGLLIGLAAIAVVVCTVLWVRGWNEDSLTSTRYTRQ